MNLYTLNIYKPDNKNEKVAQFTSVSPFQAIAAGDLLKPTASLDLSKEVKVVSVEHNMLQTENQGGYNDGLRHEINVYTTEAIV